MRPLAKLTTAIAAVSFALTSLWMYTPLLSDWMTRTKAEAAVKADLAAVRAKLYAPPEVIQIMDVAGGASYDLANGCVAASETIVYGSSLTLSEVIHKYNQGITSAGWFTETSSSPTTYASFHQDKHTELFLDTLSDYPPLSVPVSATQRFKTLYRVELVYFEPFYGCRA